MNIHARDLADGFDLEHLTPEFYADPYRPIARCARDAPVKRMRNGSYFLTRLRRPRHRLQEHQGVLLRQEKEFAPKYGDTPLYEHHTTSLVFNDPPAHTRVRRLIMGALSPRAIAAMEGDLIRLVDMLLDRIAEGISSS
jgi:cytochrome P450